MNGEMVFLLVFGTIFIGWSFLSTFCTIYAVEKLDIVLAESYRQKRPRNRVERWIEFLARRI